MFEPYAVIVVLRLNHTLRELPGGVWELLRRGVLPDDSPSHETGHAPSGRVENTFFRYTSIIGDGLRARSPAG